MTDKTPMPASGGGAHQGEADGVNDPTGRNGGGESGGGGYDNPHRGKDGDNSGFFGHGGQTDIDYHGGGQGGDKGAEPPNAVTRGADAGEGGADAGPKPGPTGPDQDFSPEYAREVTTGERRIEVIDTSGIAAAEAAGTTGVAGQHQASGEHPGSG